MHTFSDDFASFFFTHATACCWGSMHSGYREARVVRMPFWIESSSWGSPSDAHRAVSTSEVRSFSRRNGCDRVIFFSSRSGSHASLSIDVRNSKLNAPEYERKAAPSKQSPINSSREVRSCSRSAVHRSRSDCNPAMSFEAASSWRAIVSAFVCSSFSSADPCSYFSLSSSSCAAKNLTSSLIFARSLDAWRSDFSACATACRFGLTVFATP